MPQVITLGEFPRHLRPGLRVYVQAGASQPTPLLESLVDGPAIDVVTPFFPGINDFELSRLGEGSTGTVFYPARTQHRGLASQQLRCLPLHQSEIASYLESVAAPDVLLIQVAPPDAQGQCSLGVGADFVPLLSERDRVIVAEVNSQMPRVPDAPCVSWERIDFAVATDRALPEFPDPVPNKTDHLLAEQAAALINDGDCLQAGIGRLPAALLARLSDRRHLRIHTGLFSDGFARLVECGAIEYPEGSAQSSPPIIAAYVAGSARTYALAREGRIAVRSPTLTHDIAVLGAIERFVSINAGLEIDLFGQVNAETADGRWISGCGGFVDFVRGARRSRGGRSIVMVPATSHDGARSNIVAALAPGTPVTCSRSDVDIVVTEYGVARLRHLSSDERARELIAVAAPAHRDALSMKWEQLRLSQFD